MRMLVLAIVTATGVVAWSGEQASPAGGAAGTASLDVRVTVTRDGQAAPVRRAKVTLQGSTTAPQTADTDTDGAAHFQGLSAGVYKVVVDKPGFVPAGRPPSVQVGEGQAARMAIGMQRGGAIEGHLQTADGDPAMGFIVSAVRLGFGPYGKRPVSMRQTTTDDLGRFRLHTLEPGEYYVEAAPDAVANFNAPVIPGNPPKPARTYYAGTPRLTEAGVVVVGPGQQISNVSFTLASAVTATIAGSVAGASGQLPATYSIRIQRVGGAPGDVRCLLNTGQPTDRSFTCPNAPPGDYWLLATSRMTADADLEYSVARLNVQGQDIRGLAVRTAPGANVRGQIEVEGGAPLPAGLQLAALETEYEFPNADRAAGPATKPQSPNGDGTFAFGSLAGARIFRIARAPEGWALQTVSLEGVDVTDQPTAFPSGERVPALRVVITSRTGTVTGSVLTPNGQPAAGAQVIVFPADHGRWGARSRFIRATDVLPSGQYAIRGLLPGDYRVAFVDSLPDGAWEDPEVLARLERDASRVPITAGNPITIDGRIR